MWFLTPVSIDTCHLLGHSFGPKMVNLTILMKFCTLLKPTVVNSMVTIVFCDSWCLSILTPVDIDTCHLLGHSFGPKTVNLQILMKFCTLHKLRVVNSMVTIIFFLFLTAVNINNCQYWYLLSFRSKFSTKNGKCSSFDEILYFTQNEGGEFNGFDIERCKWVPKRIKTWNRKTNLVSKMLLLHYKQNW